MTWLAGALRRLLPAWLLCAACAASAAPPVAGFGVMVHYLPDKQTIADVARFDAEALAASLARMRASYLILTLGQNNGQFIAPNAALELLCPGSIENRPPRDLPMEIGRALQRRGIGLVLYLPFRAPQGDAYLMDCLGDVSEQKPPPARFIAGWTAVVREWSEHYRALAKGWWFDGVYNTRGMSAEDWNGLCAAARTGAPKRWLAFNSGEGPQRFSAKAAPCQNLMAGELLQPPAPSGPSTTPASGLAFHVLTPLGASWGQTTAPRFTAAQVRDWIADAKARGGLFTLDLPLDADYRFLPTHVALVRSATAPRP
ncbi:hypothetical protein [Variovorax sp. DXTD-1]|uniref:hypothetical protein n=1 Tax=Variovorax sp. DXTD-1 TaxID=2495592 RepID=UPI000F87903E|nr:hypothetical protein [Variovorax sp. DXTD-1]RST52053.1 hypothetical protein EJI00_07780 [Variovorax sp. DXTD-1]